MFRLIIVVLVVVNALECVHCYFTDHWAVQVDGGEEYARQIASEQGFQFVTQIIPGFYSFRQHKIMKRSLQPSHVHHDSLTSHSGVVWAEQQIAKRRVKRDLTPVTFNDPLWPAIWYLHSPTGNDMRVTEVYSRYNITGQGVKVTILDDGLEKNHTDLVANYDPGSSYDVNDNDDDPQPTYDVTNENRHGTRCAGEVSSMANNGVCGVGVAYNSKIGGIRMLDGDVTDAVEAQSLGLNPNHIDIYSVSWGPEDNGATVDGPGTLARNAIRNGILNGRFGLGSIFVWASGNGGLKGDSCSCDGYCNSIYTLTVSSVTESGTVPWYSEPCSNTMATTYSSGASGQRSIVTTDLRNKCTNKHTGTSATAPLVAGICALVLEANPRLNWRDIQYIVFLSARRANLQCDDWVVNGVGRNVSHHFGYGLLDATRMVEMAFNWSTVPQQHNCTTHSTEDFAANPLEANSRLQSVIVTTGCQPISDDNNNNNTEGQTTTSNNNNNNSTDVNNNNNTDNHTNPTTPSPTTTTPSSTTNNPLPQTSSGDVIYFLEHVECVVTLKADTRGQVELMLTSPMGTTARLLERRPKDESKNGFVRWSFMSVHSWGEDPRGEWTLVFITHDTNAILLNWHLNFYGVDTRPVVYDRYLPLFQQSSSAPLNSNNNNNNNNNAAFANRTMFQNRCHPTHYLHQEACVLNCPLRYYRYNNMCLSCNNNNNNNNKNNNNNTSTTSSTNYSFIDCNGARTSNIGVDAFSLQDQTFNLVAVVSLVLIIIAVLIAVSRGVYMVVVGRKKKKFFVLEHANDNNTNNTNNRLLKKNKNNKNGGGGVNNSNNNKRDGKSNEFFDFMKLPKLTLAAGGGDDDDVESNKINNNKSFFNAFGNNKNNKNNKNDNDQSSVPLLMEDDDGGDV